MTERTRIRPNAALWASAFVILALVFVQAGRLAGPGIAGAEMVATSGSYTMMTTFGGNEEVVIVIDNRSEDLLLYKVDNQKAINLYARESLSDMFTRARAAYVPGGGP